MYYYILTGMNVYVHVFYVLAKIPVVGTVLVRVDVFLSNSQCLGNIFLICVFPSLVYCNSNEWPMTAHVWASSFSSDR